MPLGSGNGCGFQGLTDAALCRYIRPMKAVGVRALKNRLSKYLRLVRNGEEILVTDRGELIAKLRQPSPRVALPCSALGEAVRQGRAHVGQPNRPHLDAALGAVMPAGAAVKLLDEERSKAEPLRGFWDSP